jgi:hypothetical protein
MPEYTNIFAFVPAWIDAVPYQALTGEIDPAHKGVGPKIGGREEHRTEDHFAVNVVTGSQSGPGGLLRSREILSR